MKNIPMLEYHYHFDVDVTKIFPKANRIKVGIKHASQVFASKFSKPLKPFYGGLQVNAMSPRVFRLNNQTFTTADYFSSVWNESTWSTLFVELVHKKKHDLLMAWFVAKDDQAMKKASNSVLALMRQSYIALVKKYTVSAGRAKQKHFDNKYLGTGQMFKAVKVYIERSST